VDALAERVQTLAEWPSRWLTIWRRRRASAGRQGSGRPRQMQLFRLLQLTSLIIEETREAAHVSSFERGRRNQRLAGSAGP